MQTLDLNSRAEWLKEQVRRLVKGMSSLRKMPLTVKVTLNYRDNYYQVALYGIYMEKQNNICLLSANKDDAIKASDKICLRLGAIEDVNN